MSHGTVLITGVGRRRGIAAGLAVALAAAGWDLTLNHWQPYDERLGKEHGRDDPADVAQECRTHGAEVDVISADLADVTVPDALIGRANRRDDLTAIVLAHTEGVNSGVLDTTIESWDRHYAVNARTNWLLIKAFAEQLSSPVREAEAGRIVALTSDHSAYNLPYGTSKGALDRLVVAAAIELGGAGIRANCINPGPIDTGWMDDEIREAGVAQTPLGRLGTPQDTADLVTFLLSPAGGWITGQVLYSSGGFHTSK
ncbi:SDR family oxidoreductase [Flexivirga oryzae]|uniref:3-oxoacyl-[acyl-carrier protein] reductase n=1 Tax=Flexivirga oryzae TaxID=1794944 RepID=A0A839NAM0_9MICO|nr:SDR family oxidoreductase [Flexivirga oryzae]MBB2891652.1 3-oxoacyl-[acyl-carrier protein] reductase [Flexivirga oryzae]